MDKYDDDDKTTAIFKELGKIAIIVDTIDYSGHITNYIKQNCIVKKIDHLEIPENAKDRIDFLLKYKDKFSMDEIEFYFRGIFVDSKEYDKFCKRYLAKLSEKLSLSMLEKFRTFYPTIVNENFIKPHKVLKNYFEYNLYKLKKTWS